MPLTPRFYNHCSRKINQIFKKHWFQQQIINDSEKEDIDQASTLIFFLIVIFYSLITILIRL